ncbi:S41 family peptidase [Butyrivibrio sp. JL13D10]|uniref:S41 family peptidase n=1 Tax=Butyrivibrio sp. JL13D10 TaxID=3236815 RepID=UPI0038B4DE4A
MKKRTISALIAVTICTSSIISCKPVAAEETPDYSESYDEQVSQETDDNTDASEEAQQEEPAYKTANEYSSEYPLYVFDVSSEEVIELSFFDKSHSVPYISMEETARLLNLVGDYSGFPSSYGVEYSESGNTATLTRETGYTMTANSENDTITFLDYDAFMLNPGSVRLIDMIQIPDENNEESVDNLFLHSDHSYQRYGDEITLPLGGYDIDIIKTDNGLFIPLATVSDFLFADRYFNLLFNGESAILLEYDSLINENGELTDIGNLYYSVPTGEIPKELSTFSYNELCLMLDNMYGLTALHGIRDFDSFFENTGLKDSLLSTDPIAIDNAILELVNTHLDDLHSDFLGYSCYSDVGDDFDIQKGSSSKAFDNYMELLYYTRSKYYDEAPPSYEEIGNTAYITFDDFTVMEEDYYSYPPTEDVTDTIGIMLYSFKQITRPGSPVKNVVLDMSLNTGGSVQSAAFVIGMFLEEGSFSIKNVLTDALTSDYYYVDSNLDHIFDEKDSLEKYNLYCLESPISFSAGNLVPSVFKNSHKVTILGQTSGGGTCSVLPMTSASGTIFQLSGHYQLSFVKNGSFYDIDRGAEPDYPIANLDNFYDRRKLTDYINSLY